MRIAICQIDPTVGDLQGNAALIKDWCAQSSSRGCQISVFPELALTGYPPEDLLLNETFIRRSEQQLLELASQIHGTVALIGCVERRPEGLFNAVAIVAGGSIHGYARKCRLPNYGVFDEKRYFEAADTGSLISVDGVKIGVSVCEDIWFAGNPSATVVASGAQLLINCSASPYHAGKGAQRLEMLRTRVSEHRRPIIYAALVGGQDELVFDGQSIALNKMGEIVALGAQFEEDLVVVEIEPSAHQESPEPKLLPLAELQSGCVTSSHAGRSVNRRPVQLAEVEEAEAALQLGLSSYVRKNRFNGVVFGVSGGIDSAVVATLAVDALGSEMVHAAVMPSPWSSTETQQDARDLCTNLGIELFELPIEIGMDAYNSTLADVPEGPGAGLAAENIQARIRGNLLMALSNRHGWLVLTTGNKSELAVGYSTLYGDAAGGFGLLKDVPKQLVYQLAELRNLRPDSPIPDSIIVRPPSAELRPGQKDEDSLPPYPVLDEILRLYVEQRADSGSIVAAGHDLETVERVLGLVDRAEYKRRQYPPGVKITPLAFGRDRRMPMTNGFRP